MKAKKQKSAGEDARIGMDRCARAEDWFARMRAADCTEIERAAFRRWLQESPDNEAAYRHLQTVWERTARLRTSPAIADATREALDARAPRRRFAGRRWQWPAAVAAALVLAVSLSVLGTGTGLWSLVLGGGESFVTATAEQRSITLTDGSSVLLDAESVLRVDYDDQARNLVLERGQAEFKVVHDTARPFVVEAAGNVVRALGTEFQVRVIDKTVTVTLLEGKISVDTPGLLGGILAPPRHEVLAPGQKVAVASRRESLTPKPADLEVAKGWTHGDLVFKRWRLEDLVAEMNRHSGIRIRIEDPALRELKVSGRFRAGDQQSLIQALEQEWPIRARRVEARRIALTMQGSGG
jgi:transmembrane sensor